MTQIQPPVEHRFANDSSDGVGSLGRPQSCPVCGCADYRAIRVREERFALGDEFTYAVCKRCRLVRLLTEPASMAPYYAGYSYHRSTPATSETSRGIVDRAYRFLSRILMKPLDRYYPRNTALRVLDVGCARGQFLHDLRKRGFTRLHGIEPSRQAVDAKVDEDLEIECVSLADFRPQTTFDVITLNQVFEHFANPTEMLTKLAALLSQEGILVMSFPNYQSLARHMLGSYWPGYDAPRHYFTFSPHNIKLLCGQCGLKIRRIRFISRPSQFLGGLQYLWNRCFGTRQRLEDGYFRNSRVLDLLLMPAAFLCNALGIGDMIEVHLERSR